MLVGVFVLGMLVYHMLKGVCGCKLVEGLPIYPDSTVEEERQFQDEDNKEFLAQYGQRRNYRGIHETKAEMDLHRQEQKQSRVNQVAIDQGSVIVGK